MTIQLSDGSVVAETAPSIDSHKLPTVSEDRKLTSKLDPLKIKIPKQTHSDVTGEFDVTV